MFPKRSEGAVRERAFGIGRRLTEKRVHSAAWQRNSLPQEKTPGRELEPFEFRLESRSLRVRVHEEQVAKGFHRFEAAEEERGFRSSEDL